MSEEILKVQQQLNQIKINDIPLEENGLLDEDTVDAIKKLQGITDFEQNGSIDQNLIFRLNEIIENPAINGLDKCYTFANLYNEYKLRLVEFDLSK